MNSTIQKLKNELKNTLDYWQENVVLSEKTIYGEVSCDNKPNTKAEIGSMYLSRIIYGVSAASKVLETEKYISMADVSFSKLQRDFKNPAGGYYWALDSSGEPLHDKDNINMAQAFVLYGFAEYFSVSPSEELEQAINKQVDFLLKTIYDNEGGGFYDGFNAQWEIGGDKTRFFGTHLHLLEAFTKLYECNSSFIERKYIVELLQIILDNFIEKGTNNRIHQLAFDWQPMKNTVWAGHDAECSWILCQSAFAIADKGLISRTQKLAVSIMDGCSEFAIDRNSGGAFNEMIGNSPSENQKMWWPQAEMTLGFLNCYQITGDKKYLQLALSQSDYITNAFLAKNGEWYTAVSIDGVGDLEVPKVNFWKSLYHNVRYYVDAIRRLEEINSPK